MIAINNKKIRVQRIKENIPQKLFYEKIFDTSFRNKILSDLPLDYSKTDPGNILNCSPLLNRTQEHHYFRKYNYLRYRVIKSTIGFKKSDIDPSPKPSNPITLERLSERSITEIEKLIFNMNQVRNLLLQSNLRLIIKQISKYYSVDSYNGDEFFSNGYCHVIKSIDCFDYRRGIKFSTYCVNVLKTNLFRDKMYNKKFDAMLEKEEEHKNVELKESKDSNFSEINQVYNKKFVRRILGSLRRSNIKNPDIRIKVIQGYYGLGCEQKTLQELANQFKLSRESIRQIKLDALRYLHEKSIGSYDPLV